MEILIILAVVLIGIPCAIRIFAAIAEENRRKKFRDIYPDIIDLIYLIEISPIAANGEIQVDTRQMNQLINRIGPVLNSLGIYLTLGDGPAAAANFLENLRYLAVFAKEGEIDGAQKLLNGR
ncbi:MAG: hypothetical protein OXC83_11580 [Chloroflexi bacterium]|nr:hypothetical protein [Chloroflexota bacterium]